MRSGFDLGSKGWTDEPLKLCMGSTDRRRATRMSRMASTEDEELAQRIVQTILRASVSRYDYNRGQSVPDLRID